MDSVVWVPDDSGHLSVVQTSTGYELGRYKVAPSGLPARQPGGATNHGSPSRVVVGPDGSCWVGNLSAGSIVKVGLLSNGGYIDRNHNGSADTCVDANADYLIRGAEILAWGADECVQYEVVLVPDNMLGTDGKRCHVPGEYTGSYDPDWVTGSSPSGLALDDKGDLWAATGAADDVIIVGGQVKLGLRRFWHITNARDGNAPSDVSVDMVADLTPYTTTLASNISIGATTVPCVDTTNWLPIGTARIENDDVAYTSIVSNVLHGCSGVFSNHSSGTSVYGQGHTSCGAVIDAHGILWSAGRDGNNLVRMDTTNPSGWEFIMMPHRAYGLALDGNDHLFVTGFSDNKMSRVNILTGAIDWTATAVSLSGSKGAVCTADGNVWVANASNNTITRHSGDDGSLAHAPINGGQEPYGITVDLNGNPWVCDALDDYVYYIDPTTNTIGASPTPKHLLDTIGHTGYIGRSVFEEYVPVLSQRMRHGKYFSDGVQQPYRDTQFDTDLTGE